MKYLILVPLVAILYGCDSAHSESTLRDVTLSITLPTEREKPSSEPLVLAGIRVYYGASPGMYDMKVEFTDLSSDYTLTNLLNNPYYVVVTAYDDAGRESMYSDEIMIPIKVPAPMRPTITAVKVN